MIFLAILTEVLDIRGFGFLWSGTAFFTFTMFPYMIGYIIGFHKDREEDTSLNYFSLVMGVGPYFLFYIFFLFMAKVVGPRWLSLNELLKP